MNCKVDRIKTLTMWVVLILWERMAFEGNARHSHGTHRMWDKEGNPLDEFHQNVGLVLMGVFSKHTSGSVIPNGKYGRFIGPVGLHPATEPLFSEFESFQDHLKRKVAVNKYPNMSLIAFLFQIIDMSFYKPQRNKGMPQVVRLFIDGFGRLIYYKAGQRMWFKNPLNLLNLAVWMSHSFAVRFREASITYPWVQWSLIDELRFFEDPHAQQEKDRETPILDSPRAGSEHTWKMPIDLKLVLKTACLQQYLEQLMKILVSMYLLLRSLQR